jgi:hypothetical protein
MNSIYLIAIAFGFGVTNKLADLMNEHGLRWFKQDDFIFGVIWGGLGALLIVGHPLLVAPYLSLVLSWIVLLQLDHVNHALAGVMMILASAWMAVQYSVDLVATIIMLLAFVLVSVVQSRTRKRHAWLDKFWRLRLRIYLIPFVYSLYVGDFLPFWTTVSGMIGVEIVTNYYSYKGVK